MKIRGLVLTLLAFSLVSQAGFSAPAKSRVSSGKNDLKAAIKKLTKTKSYSVNASVLGGLATNKKHKVKTVSFNKAYKGHVFGPSKRPVMHIPA